MLLYFTTYAHNRAKSVLKRGWAYITSWPYNTYSTVLEYRQLSTISYLLETLELLSVQQIITLESSAVQQSVILL